MGTVGIVIWFLVSLSITIDAHYSDDLNALLDYRYPLFSTIMYIVFIVNLLAASFYLCSKIFLIISSLNL